MTVAATARSKDKGQPQFNPNDPVVHPNHGLGCIGRTEEQEFGGQKLRFLTVEFERAMLTMRIPEAKLATSGLRTLCSRRAMQAALKILPGAAVAPSGHWSKHRVQFEEKLNSGQPKLLAELVRDLNGGRSTPGGRLYREAVLRLAEELAAVEGVAVERAQEMIEGLLPPRADKG